MPVCKDAFGRIIDYLRISVTDRCNLRCVYCMPPEGVPWRPRAEILRYEDIVQVVQAAAELGVRKLRLTGGEPLVRAGLPDLVAMLACMPGIEEVSLTTNGVLLDRLAEPLAAAGLARVNISLDTLRPERFAAITRLGHFEDVWRGIMAAEGVGLTPIKLNCVVIRSLNDDELPDFARLTLAHPWHVRFIELMPIGNQSDCGEGMPAQGERFISVAQMKARLAQVGPPVPVGPVAGSGPARVYQLPGALGTVGFISPVSEHFCATCNRLRLTADGRLRPCLLSDLEVDLRPCLQNGAQPVQLKALIDQAVQAKPQGHRLPERIFPEGRTMSAIGG